MDKDNLLRFCGTRVFSPQIMIGLKENRMTLRQLCNVFLFMTPLLLRGCESFDMSPAHSPITEPKALSQRELLSVIETLHVGGSYDGNGTRVVVDSSYPAASGALCKRVTLYGASGTPDPKVACFQKGEARFVDSPFFPSSTTHSPKPKP